MTKKQTIIQLYLEGMSKRKIAKNTKKSRNTVDKYVQEFEKGRNEDVRNLAITEEIMRPPTYKEIKGRKKVLTEECKRAHYFSTSFSNYCGRKYEIMCSVFHVIPEYAKLCSN